MTGHQYGVPTAVVFSRETSGSVMRCRLFSQASFRRLYALFTFQKILLTTSLRWTPGAHTDRSTFPRICVQIYPLTTWCGNSSQLHLNKRHSICCWVYLHTAQQRRIQGEGAGGAHPPPGMTCGRFLINTVQSLDRHTKSALSFDMYSQQFTLCYVLVKSPLLRIRF